MMSTNVRPSSVLPLIGRIAPQTLAGAGSAVTQTAWLQVGTYEWLAAVVNVGAVGAGANVVLSWLQATSENDVNEDAKVLNTGGFEPVMFSATGDAIAEGHVGEIDTNNGFTWVQAVFSSHVGNILCGMTLHGGAPKFETGVDPSTVP